MTPFPDQLAAFRLQGCGLLLHLSLYDDIVANEV